MENENKIKNILSELSPDMKANPYFSQRVMYVWEKERSLKKRVLFWRWTSVVAMTATGAIAGVLFLRTSSSVLPNYHRAAVGEAIVMHLEDELPTTSESLQLHLKLPEGVEFVSHNSELAQSRDVVTTIDAIEAGRVRLPFVIRGLNTGEKNLELEIMDQDSRVLKTKKISIEFIRDNNRGQAKSKKEII